MKKVILYGRDSEKISECSNGYGSPATTLQEILALGLHGRARLEVTVTGPHAERTLDRVERLLGGVV